MVEKERKPLLKDKVCSECNKGNMTTQGLIGHLRMIHGIKTPSSTDIAIQKALAAANLSQNTTVLTENNAGKVEKETKLDDKTAETIEKHDPATCPNCIVNAAKINELTNSLQLAQQRAANAEAILEASAEDETPAETSIVVPEVDDFIAHCEDGSCKHHADDWDAVKARIAKAAVENSDGTMLPDKVIEAEGLRRGLIPKSIVLPGVIVRS